MTVYADLHLHSTASDGVDSPAKVVRRAKKKGLSGLALTDHDSVGGVAEARQAAEEVGLAFISGCEMTSYLGSQEFHILGYGVDDTDEALLRHCRWCAKVRIERAEKIGAKLRELGVPIDMEAVMAKADAGVIARPHVADALVEAGHVKDRSEAFDKYLANDKPAAVPKPGVEPRVVIQLIHNAGGVAVLAHGLLGNGGAFGHRRELLADGLDGFEVWHSEHGQGESETVEAEADRLGLLKTGGSDCHGVRGEQREIMGRWGVDRPRFEKLLEAIEARRRTR